MSLSLGFITLGIDTARLEAFLLCCAGLSTKAATAIVFFLMRLAPGSPAHH
jgi:hypothetical protein